VKALDKLISVAALLAGPDVPDPAKESEILVTEALGIDKADLYSGSVVLTQEQCDRLDMLTGRRLKGEPLQYIVGHVGFWGLTIRVGPGVLIPRPETELLVETALRELNQEPVRILDLCTGSGCIALALAKHLPSAIVYGVEKSVTALNYAAANARDNGMDNVHFVRGDLFGPLGCARFRCIVSNPPYVRSGDIAGLQREVRDFEPAEALDGGEDGLSFYRRIFADAPIRLSSGGVLILEMGWGQATEIRNMAWAAGMGRVSFVSDFSGIERIVVARRD
jgi:release factor glutamine methyltransferase